MDENNHLNRPEQSPLQEEMGTDSQSLNRQVDVPQPEHNEMAVSQRTQWHEWMLPIFAVMVVLGIVFLIVMGCKFWPNMKICEVHPVNIAIQGDMVVERNDGQEYSVEYILPDGASESFTVLNTPEDTIAQYVTRDRSTKLGFRSGFPFDVTSDATIPPRVIDITFDLSGSIWDLIRQQPNYRNDILSKLNKQIENADVRPGDLIRVRFLGGHPSFVSEDFITVSFIGPMFNYRPYHDDITNKDFVILRGYTFDYDTRKIPGYNDQEIYVSSRSMLQQKLRDIYLDATQRGTNFGGGSSLLSHIDEIIVQNDQQDFNSILYLLFTDGEFFVEDDIAYQVGGSWSNLETYKQLYPKLIEMINQGKILKQDFDDPESSRRLSKNRDKDEVVLIGLKNYNIMEYRYSFESLLGAIFRDAKVRML